MAWDDPYLSVDEFKARTGQTDDVPARDAAIGVALAAASRQIDRWCGLDPRVSFNQRPGQTFYLTPNDPWWLTVPDLVAIDELATDFGKRDYPTLWDASDYDLYPIDADARMRPFRQIRTRPFGKHTFPAPFGGWQAAPLALPSGTYPRETGLTRGVRITGTWGWPAVPTEVKEACYLIANRLKALWNAPFGSTGSSTSSDMGQLNMTQAMTPLIQQLIAPYRVIAI